VNNPLRHLKDDSFESSDENEQSPIVERRDTL